MKKKRYETKNSVENEELLKIFVMRSCCLSVDILILSGFISVHFLEFSTVNSPTVKHRTITKAE